MISERIIRLSERYDRQCQYCGVFTNFDGNPDHVPTADHIVSRARGGTDEWENLTLACHKCNSLKGDMTVDEFVEKLKRNGVIEQNLTQQDDYYDRIHPVHRQSLQQREERHIQAAIDLLHENRPDLNRDTCEYLLREKLLSTAAKPLRRKKRRRK